MGLSNAQQLTVLLYSLLFGVGLGAAYDVLRIFRVFVSCHPVAVLFQDLFYFVLAAVASFLFVFEVNDGTVRLFILAAFFVGGLAFRGTLGQGTVALSRRAKAFFRGRIDRRTHKRNALHKPSEESKG